MCVSPISVKVRSIDGNRSMLVPCGKCPECLKTRQNDYLVRIYEELKQVSKSCFVTLTYRPDKVPYIMKDGKKYLVVWKRDVQNWLKRFRTNYERKTGKTGIRFFLCSEYGPKTNRPHYHAIFFGLSKSDLESALVDWYNRFGYTMAKDIDYTPKSLETSARYVSKYATKGFFENPFCCSELSSSFVQAFQQRTRSDLCEKNARLPFIFFGFSIDSPKEILGLEWHTISVEPFCSEIFGRLFGRGIKKEVRSY